MKKILSLSIASLLALGAPAAYADPAAEMEKIWRDLGNTQMSAVIERAAVMTAFISLEQEKLSEKEKQQDLGQQELVAINRALPRTFAYLQNQVSQCYAQAANPQTASAPNVQSSSAHECAQYDLLLNNHLHADYTKQKEHGANYTFNYTLHPQTVQWQKQHETQTQALLQKAPEARKVFKQSIKTLPFSIMFSGMVNEYQKTLSQQP